MGLKDDLIKQNSIHYFVPVLKEVYKIGGACLLAIFKAALILPFNIGTLMFQLF